MRDTILANTQLEKCIQRLTTEALLLICEYPELTRILQLLTAPKALLKPVRLHLWVYCYPLMTTILTQGTHRELVKYAGLDPYVKAYFQHLEGNARNCYKLSAHIASCDLWHAETWQVFQ
ncbi:MAG: hypothetical protein V3V18_13290 [Methylococcales bacterium]